MDGITATIELRRRGCVLPIVGLTANADDETRQEAIKVGMNELLTKPISIAALSRVMRRMSLDSSHVRIEKNQAESRTRSDRNVSSPGEGAGPFAIVTECEQAQ